MMYPNKVLARSPAHVHACVRACACVCACVRVCVRACVNHEQILYSEWEHLQPEDCKYSLSAG